MFAPSEFFQQHKKFIKVTASAHSAQDLLKWGAYTESKLRLLVKKLEFVLGVTYAIPWHEGCSLPIEKVIMEKTPNELKSGEEKEEEKAPETIEVEVHRTAYFVALVVENIPPIPGEKKKKLDLSKPASDWLHMTNNWPGRASTMSIGFEYVDVTKKKDFVFPNGQKPAVEKKKKRKRGEKAASDAKAKSVPNTSVETMEPDAKKSKVSEV